MKFKGYGTVYNSAKRETIVNFRKTPEYETDDVEEIRLLRASGYITEEFGDVAEIKPIIIDEIIESQPKKSRKELIKMAKDANIKGSDRMKTADILKALDL